MTKSPLEHIAFIALFGIFFYLFAVKCTADKKIDKAKYPHYPYVIEKVK